MDESNQSQAQTNDLRTFFFAPATGWTWQCERSTTDNRQQTTTKTKTKNKTAIIL
jgi:hypothetical protein